MDRKKLLKKIGQKLQEIRRPFKYSHREMADRIGAYRSSYLRYESGETAPQITSLYQLGNKFKISLDWLIRDNGPMYYDEKEMVQEKKEKAPPLPPIPPTPKTTQTDIGELLEYMERIPLLRYEILAHFYKFKEDRKEMLEPVMKKTAQT